MGDSNGDLVIGVDLGGTKVLSAVIDEDGEILGSQKERTQGASNDKEVFEKIVESIRGAIEDADVSLKSVRAIGMGAPGALNPDTGVISLAPNLGLENYPMGPNLKEEFGVPAFVNNDVNLGTYGEWKMGAAAGSGDVLGVFVGTGIGGGMILNGRLYEGFHRTAGEIGHMVVALGGPECGCGNYGCWEAIASRSAISDAIYERIQAGESSWLEKKFKGDPPAIRSKNIAKAYEKEDPLAVEVLNQAAEVLGMGIGSLVNILAPEIVVLGGGMIEALGDEYIKRIDDAVRGWAFPASVEHMRIVEARLGDDAVLQGGAWYARDRMAEAAQA